MLKTTHRFTTKSNITNLASLDNNLFFYTTSLDGIKLFKSPDSKILKNIQSELVTLQTTSIVVSPDAKYIAIANLNVIKVLSIDTSALINTISIQNNISLVCFDSSSKYIIVASVDGELFEYMYDSKFKLSTLHRFDKTKNNRITALSFKDTKVICASANGSIAVIDIYTHIINEIILSSIAKITSVVFLNSYEIAMGDSYGNLSFICTETYKVLKKLTTPFEYINKIIPIPNSDYILLSGDDYYLTLINVKEKKTSILKYLSFKSKVVSIDISKDAILYIALKNNDIFNINLKSTKELVSSLEYEEISKAYLLVERNPLLKSLSEYYDLESIYKTAYKEATLGLINKDKRAFFKLQSKYRDIKSKQKEIKELQDAFKEYQHLKDLYKDKKYAICYALIEKHPPLKATPEYKKLEEKYRVSLLAAQFQMSMGKKDVAQGILKDYITIISKRPVIKTLLENRGNLYDLQDKTKVKLDEHTLRFQQAYDKNEFNSCYEILDKHKFINDLESAKLLNNHYKNIISKCDKSALQGDIKKVQDDLGSLLKINTRKQKTGSLLRVSFHVKIINLTEVQNFKEAENMIYSYIDIFGIDIELTELMRIFEELSSIKLAISDADEVQKGIDDWFDLEYFSKNI